MNTSEPDRYCLIVRKPLWYGAAYVGQWPAVLRQVAVRRAGGVDADDMRVIRFSDDQRINREEARRAFQSPAPERLACPECNSPVMYPDGGAGICTNDRCAWTSPPPEWQAVLKVTDRLGAWNPSRIRRHRHRKAERALTG